MVNLNRWNINHAEVPSRAGKLDTINKFDCGAFLIHPDEANKMGPLTRSLLEVVFEAIYDAGVNPSELEGTKTGVFIPTLKTDCTEAIVKHNINPPNEAHAEIHRITTANLLSYLLKLNGPSAFLDTGCSASLYTLEEAYRAIRRGDIDAAIIAGAMMNLHPAGTAECYRQGFLSTDGCCKVFDNTANGYVKSEAVTAIFIQKLKNAKRVYAHVKHCKVSCDGFKEEGIGYPSTTDQVLLFSRLYKESDLNPIDLGYVEAHGTGTIVGDLQEATAIERALGRDGEALLVGSVKSNMGHAEQVAGLCALAKAVIIMESGLIPPNLHYQQAREDIEALRLGKIKVPTEIFPFVKNRLLAINSFGLGGTNSHCVLKANEKNKIDDQISYPRLVCVSGRTYEAVKSFLEDIKLDVELFALLNNIHKMDIPQNKFRGTAIFSNTKKNITINECNYKKNQLYLILGAFNNNLIKIGLDILKLPLGETIFTRVTKILQYDFAKLLLSKENCNQRLLASIIQIILLNLLQSLEIELQVVSVYPYGIFAEAYAKNILTFEETIFFASLIAEEDSEQLLSDDNETKRPLKFILHYLLNNYNPKEIPFNENLLVLAFGDVNSIQDESDFFTALSR